jgi:signal transduction histidine kinase
MTANLQPAMVSTRAIGDRLPSVAAELATPRLIDQPVHVLLHEVRNSLSAILTTMHVLARRHPGDAEIDQATACVRRQVAFMQEIMAEAEAAERPSPVSRRRRDTVDVQQCLRDAVELCAGAIDARRHRVQVRVPTEPVWWQGCAALLVQALANLIDNAAKYTPQPSEIRVGLGRHERELALVVADDGIGLSADGLRDVLAPFARAAPAAAINPDGQGIGLALVDEFARRNGGTLVAQSRGPGRGCSFTIWLPLAPNTSRFDQ